MTFPLATVAAFGKHTATEYNNLIAAANDLGHPTWTNYTPTLSASGGGLSMGAATVAADYRRALNGDLITYRGVFSWGAGMSFGSGYLRCTVPVAASATATLRSVGDALINDASAQSRPGSCRFEGANTIIFDNSAGVVTGTSPMVWATGDTMLWTVQYEAA